MSSQCVIGLWVARTSLKSVNDTCIGRTLVPLDVVAGHFFTITVFVLNEIQVCGIIVVGHSSGEYVSTEFLLDLRVIDAYRLQPLVGFEHPWRLPPCSFAA